MQPNAIAVAAVVASTIVFMFGLQKKKIINKYKKYVTNHVN